MLFIQIILWCIAVCPAGSYGTYLTSRHIDYHSSTDIGFYGSPMSIVDSYCFIQGCIFNADDMGGAMSCDNCIGSLYFDYDDKLYYYFFMVARSDYFGPRPDIVSSAILGTRSCFSQLRSSSTDSRQRLGGKRQASGRLSTRRTAFRGRAKCDTDCVIQQQGKCGYFAGRCCMSRDVADNEVL